MANEHLKQTKGSFKFIGKVSGLDKEGAYKELEASRGRNEGKTYRSLRFMVQTSETNKMMVEMFDFEPELVYLWNSKEAKKVKEEGKKYEGEKLQYEQWKIQQDKLKEEGYTILQTRIGVTTDDNGKIIAQGLPSYVSSKMIYDNLTNGDSVKVEGEIRYSKYQNREGKTVEQKKYIIRELFKSKNDVDFTSDKFEEMTFYEQEMVFIGADNDKKEKKVYVTGRTIDYSGNYQDTQMVIDYSDGNSGIDKGMEKLADAFTKRFKFGDLINVYGNTINRVIVEEVEGEDDDVEDLLKILGGKAKPKHTQKYQARTYISEMQIHGADKWDRGVYTEEDFVKDELLENNDSLDFGGKAKPKNNPFDEIDDDDLPF